MNEGRLQQGIMEQWLFTQTPALQQLVPTVRKDYPQIRGSAQLEHDNNEIGNEGHMKLVQITKINLDKCFKRRKMYLGDSSVYKHKLNNLLYHHTH